MRPRVCVIGVGSIGERHLRCFGQTNRADLSICEVNDTLRSEIAERYSIDEVYADFDEILKSPPDAAVICTPAHLHISMAIKLANAGTSLLIEKPLSTTTDSVAELIDVVDKKKVSTRVAYVMRMNPLLVDVRQALVENRFGKPVQVSTMSGQHFPTYRPAYREIYYTDRATGGGAIQDALTHQVNAVEWLVGPMTHVAADAAHQVLEGVEVEDTVHVIARHRSDAGEVQASFSLNQHQAPNETTMKIVCQRGTMQIEFHNNRWLWQSEPEQGWQIGAQIELERDDMFVSQAQMFLDVLQSGATVSCSLAEGLQTLKANLAILRAADTQTWQEVK